MALIFMDSFDHYTLAEMQGKYDNVDSGVTIQNGIVRSGLQAAQSGPGGFGDFTKNVPVATKYTVGFAWRVNLSSGATSNVLYFQDDLANINVRLWWNPSGTFSLVVGFTTVVATSTQIFPTGSWHYLEMQVFTDPTVGTITFKVDGVVWASFTGNTVKSGADANIARIVFNASLGGAATIAYIDDLYITDTTNTSGVGNTGFLGDKRICCLFSRAAGSNAAWTPNPANPNYQNVQENLPGNDGDTSYNSTLTVNAIDSFLFQSIPFSSGVIQGVQEVLCARIDDAGPHTIQGFCKSGAFSGVVGPTFTVPSNYGYTMHFVQENDPNTPGVYFTITNFNLAEWGYKFLS